MSIVKAAAANSYSVVENLLTRVRSKQANAEPDPGGFEGGTDHPTKNVDNGTITVSEGERSAENTKDVKKDIPASVDATPEGVGDGKQDSVQLNIGTEQSATGDDPSSETSSVADKLPDPGGYEGGTSHPANLDSVGEKYSSFTQKVASVRDLGNSLLAKLAMSGTKQAAAAPATPAAPAQTPPVSKAAADGAVAATAAIQAQQQRDALVSADLEETLKMAEDNASRTGVYLANFFANRPRVNKTAGDDSESSDGGDDEGGDEKKEKSEGGGDDKGGDSKGGDKGGNPFSGGGGDGQGATSSPPGDLGGAPSGGGGGGDPLAAMGGGGAPPAGGGGSDPNALMALLGAGGGGAPPAGGGLGGAIGAPSPADMLGGGGGGAPPMGGGAPAGGDPLAALGGGGAPPMGGGAPPMGGGGLAAGSGGGLDPAMLMQVLAELGISPEALHGQAVAKTAALLAGQKPQRGAWAPRNQSEKTAYDQMLQTVREFMGK